MTLSLLAIIALPIGVLWHSAELTFSPRVSTADEFTVGPVSRQLPVCRAQAIATDMFTTEVNTANAYRQFVRDYRDERRANQDVLPGVVSLH